MSKLREIIKTILINFIVFCALLVVVVGIIELQYWCKKLPRNDKVHFKEFTWGHQVRYNKWGFRERDFDVSTLHKDDQFVVMVLGDSFTFGSGLSETQRYSNLLEEYLQSEYPDKEIIVLNFGMVGLPTIEEKNILRHFYQAIRLDLIIVGFCFNDPMAIDFHERLALRLQRNLMVDFLRTLRLYGTAKMIRQVYVNIFYFIHKIDSRSVVEAKAYDKNREEWQNFEGALVDIVTMAREVTRNTPIFISLNSGVSNKVSTDYNRPDSLLQIRLGRHHQAELAAKQAGFIVTNVEEELKRFKNYVMAVVPGEDGHPTAEMNEVYAQKLFSVIKEHKFLEK